MNNTGGNQTFDTTSNNSSSLPFEELPAGLAMAFAHDTNALVRFTNLSNQQQDEIIRRAKNVKSRDEMRRLVSSLYESDLMG